MTSIMSLLEFAQLLPHLAAEAVVAEAHALEHAAKIVEKEAKDAIGHYQEASGPFVSWAELSDVTKLDREHQGFPENEPELRTGGLRDSIEHTVGASLSGPHSAEIGSNSDIMVWQELGTVHMPPRSILGGAAARKEEEVVEVLGGAVVAALIGEKVFEGRLPII